MANLVADTNIQRILIIKWSALGDIAMSSCIIEDIALAFPAAQIDLNTLQPWDKLFHEDPRFHRIIAMDVRGKQNKWRNIWRWINAVRHGHYDLIVDLQSNDRSRLLLIALRILGGRSRYLIGNRPRWPYDFSGPEEGAQPNPVDRMRASLHDAGIPTQTARPVFYIPERYKLHAQQLQQQYALQEGCYALFYPGCQAAGYLKRWGENNYAELARLMLTQHEVDHVVLIGSQDEMEDCRRIAELAGEGVINLCGQTEVLEIIPLAQGAKWQVGNDTGTAHLAAASDAPMVVVCGPTDAYRVRPQGSNVMAIQAELPCMNCYCKHECTHHSCMKIVRPEHVLQALRHPTANQVHFIRELK